MGWTDFWSDSWSPQLGLPDLAPKAPKVPSLDIPPPPIPAAPANNAPLSPILGDKARDQSDTQSMLKAKRRGTQSLTIDLTIGGSGLSVGGGGPGTGGAGLHV